METLTGEMILSKIHELPKGKRLRISDVNGLEEKLSLLAELSDEFDSLKDNRSVSHSFVIPTAPGGGLGDYVGTLNRITVTGNVIDIATGYVGQSSITTLGTISTGVWNGTPIANAYLANSTISGISLGSNLANLTVGSTLLYNTSTTYNGGNSRTININLSNANNWAALQTFGTNISIGGVTATGATGTGNNVFSNSPTLVTPNLGVPSVLTLTNATGLPVGGLTGLGTNVATWLGTPSFTNLNSAITGDTLAGLAASQTFTNKTIAAGSNTITGLTNTNLSGTAAISNANLANSTISGVALGGTLANLTIGGTLQFSTGSTYNGGTARVLNINLTNNNTWTGKQTFDNVVKIKAYTVSTLPAGTAGDMAYVTDALTPTYGATVAGGGAVVTRVFHNGTNWIT